MKAFAHLRANPPKESTEISPAAQKAFQKKCVEHFLTPKKQEENPRLKTILDVAHHACAIFTGAKEATSKEIQKLRELQIQLTPKIQGPEISPG